jgi:solute carrier family 35
VAARAADAAAKVGRGPDVAAGAGRDGTDRPPAAGPAHPPRPARAMDGGSPPAASSRRVVLAVAFFCCSSLGAIFINKACLTHYRFSFPFFLMLLQVGFTLSSISVLARLRPRAFAPVPVKRADLRRLALPTALFVANVSVGLSALTRVNIPMFSAFRRITVLFVMTAEFVLLQKTHSRRVVAAVVTLAAGAFVSALGDVTFSPLGYLLVFANNILTAAYLASIKKVMADLQITPYSLLYYMSILSFLPILLLAVATNDVSQAMHAYATRPVLHDSPLFVPALLFVAASALCVNLSTSMCTHVTSPLTTSVAGQLKNVLQTVLGFFSWGYVPTPLNVCGLLVALGGQIAFGYFKYTEARPASDAPAPPARPAPGAQRGAGEADRPLLQSKSLSSSFARTAPPAAPQASDDVELANPRLESS